MCKGLARVSLLPGLAHTEQFVGTALGGGANATTDCIKAITRIRTKNRPGREQQTIENKLFYSPLLEYTFLLSYLSILRSSP